MPDGYTENEWPPDGSLHFYNCGVDSGRAVPNTHAQYEFSSNVGEDDYRIVKLSMEIMKRFCGSRQVLTKFISDKNFSEKEKFQPEYFAVQYRRFLKNLGFPSNLMYAKEEKELLILTQGFDATAFWANHEIRTWDYCYFHFYLLPDALMIHNAKGAAEAVDAGKYDVWFELVEYGPCALNVILNAETVDAKSLQAVIEKVCKENDILFLNPPGAEV
ncbi:hypothetical protein KQI82_12825 [Oscillibacter sp. MSJ-2]|uniref:Uncharacterized protein n=1 Tax=Dysosmobacter acutus TaxID=2841504 RepID=A0ABS6FBY1_9FIRM|nr:hypothetical protein [Dysosmobacter acutus]MBU5627794.1 hypothetical protein [Dysosmobacter acutus]